MAKKRGDKVRVPLQEAPSKPFNPAFSGLSALRAQLPDAPEPAPAVVPRKTKRPADSSAKVIVTREKKGRGGKTVTRVARLPLTTAEVKALADLLKRTLGCGGTVEEGDVLLSGDQTDRTAAWLRTERGWRVVVGN